MNFDLRIFDFAHSINRDVPLPDWRSYTLGEGVKHENNESYYTVFDYYETLVVAQGRFVSPEPPIMLTQMIANK